MIVTGRAGNSGSEEDRRLTRGAGYRLTSPLGLPVEKLDVDIFEETNCRVTTRAGRPAFGPCERALWRRHSVAMS